MKTLGLCLLAGLGLSACATGMNNGAVVNSMDQSAKIVTQYPVETAMLNIYAKASNETLYAIIDDFKVTMNFEVKPKGLMVFNGQSVQGSEATTITKINNRVVDTSVGINYFSLNPLVFHGFTGRSGDYSIAAQTANLPKMAKVGDSSTFLTENVYADSTKRNKINSYTQTWRLSQASNNSAWFCIDSSENLLLDYDPEGTQSECYRINEKGDILDSKVTSSYPTDQGIEVLSFTRG